MSDKKLQTKRTAELSKYSIEAFDKARDDNNVQLIRDMYRAMFEIASTSHDAVNSIRRSQLENYKPAADTPEPEDFPTYTMTSGGRLWTWRCGWQEMDKLGRAIGSPIGHLAFRKFRVAKKTGNRWQDNWMKISRPEGPWRRHIDCILTHPLYGNGQVLATDGLHAIFEFTVILNPETGENTKRKAEVQFSSLSEPTLKTSHNNRSVNSVNKSAKPAARPKMSLTALDLL